jgi:TorA maturation chaperone TorD
MTAFSPGGPSSRPGIFSGPSMDIPLINPRAVLAMTLSRAFLPPLEEGHAAALCVFLADDLADLDHALNLEILQPLAAYRDACTLYERESPLVHYSHLFLSPPPAARLNLGWYLDGVMFGPTQDALRRWFGIWGVEKRDSFLDLLDHAASLLEFVGMLDSREAAADAANFTGLFLHPALAGLERDLAASATDSPYRHLVACTRQALLALYPPLKNTGSRRRAFAARAQRPDWVHCEQCGEPIATARDLAVMRRTLHAAGLPAEHLSVCPACREIAQGWDHRGLPKPR